VFSVNRAHYNKQADKLYIFRPEDHYNRFEFACRLCRYGNFLGHYVYSKFLKLLVDLLQINKVREDAYIRITNFSDENRITPKFGEYRDSLCAFLYPLGDYVPTSGVATKSASSSSVELPI
jgi:branched-chain amino acid aminotransferase